MQTATARRLAWSLSTLAVTMAFFSLAISVLALLAGGRAEWLPAHLLVDPAVTIAFAYVGALVASRQPRNPIGWVLCVTGLAMGLTIFAAVYQRQSESGWAGGPLPGVGIAEWLNGWIWVPATLLPMTFLLLLFPDGRLPSARWWPVGWAAGLGLAAFILTAALNPSLTSKPLPGPANTALQLVTMATYVLLAVGTFGSVAALVVRFRRSRGIEREQLKWLAYASVLAMLLGFVASGVLAVIWPDDPVVLELTIILSQVGLAVVAIGAGIAILRYRLYNIDLLINRTLVYVALSAGVVGLYVLLVGSLGILFQASGNFVLALIATGLAALLAQPMRTRLQRGVNRLMYGERDDPYAVLSRLSQQLKTTLAPTAVLPSIAEAVAQTLKLPYVALALKQGGGLQVAAAYGVPSGEPVQLPLVYQAETVGEMLVEPRQPGESFTVAERRLLEDIALQAGIAAHAVRLTADLQRARERLVATREEERRRLRRDLHDGLGPQLASMTLTAGAARELMRHDVDAADMLLQELAGHAQTAISDIRRVIYGLRPPALDDLGLVPALREQASRYSRAGLNITINAPDRLPPLAAAVEVAAYRIVQEALTNVVRHAHAHTCTVCLRLDDAGQTLEVEIKDDGAGLPAGNRPGVGLTSMRERTTELGGTCLIESEPGRGTRIRARLPLRNEGVQEDAWSESES